MSIRVLFFLLVILPLNSFAAQKAITEDGQIVILNDDQTWMLEESKDATKYLRNQKRFVKSASQTFRVKATPTTSAVYIDPGKWTFSKEKDGSNKLLFKSKIPQNSDLYGMLIPEGIEIPLESLSEIAFDNAKEAAPDARIVKKEYRIVNSKKILFMEMEGTMKSINFKYVGYYSSNKSGTVQLIMYSSASIIDSKVQEIESFLNGFVGE